MGGELGQKGGWRGARRFRLALLPVLACLLLFAAAAGGAGKAAPGALSQGDRKTLLLLAKDPADWSVVKGGGSGRLNYDLRSGAYSLVASGLQRRSSHALIRYVDAPAKGEILARGVSDPEGRLELHGVWRNWTGKFWLVSGEDVAGSVGGGASLRAWRPTRYLFEEKPLGVPCNCPETEEP